MKEKNYYKISTSFLDLIQQKDAQKVNLEQSVKQHIKLIVTTRLKSLRYDESYGSNIWERDFESNIYLSKSKARNEIQEYLQLSIGKYEQRIQNESIKVTILLETQNSPDTCMKINILCNLKDNNNTSVSLTFLMNISPFLTIIQ